jgi:hypothetical protein
LENEQLEKRKKSTKFILIIATIFFALSVIPALFVAVMSVMIFDSGVTTTRIVFYSFIVSYPLICLLSFLSWVFYGYKKYAVAIFISLLPLLNIIFLLITAIFLS